MVAATVHAVAARRLFYVRLDTTLGDEMTMDAG